MRGFGGRIAGFFYFFLNFFYFLFFYFFYCGGLEEVVEACEDLEAELLVSFMFCEFCCSLIVMFVTEACEDLEAGMQVLLSAPSFNWFLSSLFLLSPVFCI